MEKTGPKAIVQAVDQKLPTEQGTERGLDSILSFGTDFAHDGGRSPTRGRNFSRASIIINLLIFSLVVALSLNIEKALVSPCDL